MLNLKKTAVAVLALSSSAVFAGSMGPVCSAVNVTVPCESTAFEFGAKALYLKPTLGRASSGPVAGDISPELKPNYNWGFFIEGAYHFNTGNDVNINWYHVSRSRSAEFGAQPTTSYNTGPLAVGSVNSTYLGGGATIKPKWDAVNFEFGQHVDFGENKSIRFHGGAQYARLTNDTFNYNGTFLSGSIRSTSLSTDLNYNPTLNAFGPRLGMDMAYDFGNGLGIYANGATAILAGTRSENSTYSDAIATVGGTTSRNAYYTNTSKTVIVPEFDAKLGVTYTYAMAQGDLTADVGWLWTDYIRATSFLNAGTPTDVDFGLQGLQFGLKYVGNVA